MLTTDLIKNVTGEYDLEMVQFLKLVKIELPSITNLHFCVNLVELNLSDNRISDLGAGLKGLSKLQSLNLARNSIKYIDNGLFGLSSLRLLCLEGNDIADTADLSNLQVVAPTLQHLYLRSATGDHENPVCNDPGYVEAARSVCKGLTILDGESLELRDLCGEDGGAVKADPKYTRELGVEKWLGEEARVGGAEPSVLKDPDVKDALDEFKDGCRDIDAELSRQKAILRAADNELTRLMF